MVVSVISTDNTRGGETALLAVAGTGARGGRAGCLVSLRVATRAQDTKGYSELGSAVSAEGEGPESRREVKR